MEQTKPMGRDTVLNDYFPLPRQVLDFPLSATAMLLYAVLLDRGTLSQKNGYTNETGQVYVIYTLEHLAETMNRSVRRITGHLKELEQAGLIRRERCGMNSPSRIFLSIPGGHFCPVTVDEYDQSERTDLSGVSGRKRLPNNLRKQQKNNNLYEQYCQEESL